MIKCPTCGESKFELHTVGALVIRQNKPELTKAAKYFTCVHCEYVIAQPSDLNPAEILVYILGNSLSKQRQGLVSLNNAAEEKGKEAPFHRLAATVDILNRHGYFSHLWDNEETIRRWIFTKAAWEKYQADPTFKLGKGPYIVKTEEMF